MNQFPSVFESIKDLSSEHVSGLLTLAAKFKSYAKDWQGLPVPFLKTPIIATSFLENSTRTKHSFAIAIHKLGATYIDFNANTSSLKKGENLEETLLTLKYQGVDLCIIRNSISNELQQFKEDPPIKIINAGDGTHQHPTQALLDLFTMVELGMNLKGKTITIIGDVVHSRVGHSLIDLLPQFGAKIILCGPKEFLPSPEEENRVELVEDVDEAMRKSDLLYLLRIQKERHSEELREVLDNYHQQYGINLDRMKKHQLKIPVFHPGPANIGVEISLDLLKSPLSCCYQQVENSVFMRMAILQAILQNQDKTLTRNLNIKKNYGDLQYE